MNRREIVTAALLHRETRPIPYTIGLTTQAAENALSSAARINKKR